MKRQLLFASLAVLTTAVNVVQAQDPGDRDKVIYSTNLSLEWYGAPTGECLNAGGGASRSGIGVNGKFYLTVNNKGVAVYNKDGQIKFIDNKDTWVSINCDDAGHVYFRNDKGGWAGPEGAGWYLSDNAQFCVIDSKSDEIIKHDIPMAGGVKCRFDALPHVMGDMVNEFVEIPVTANATGNIGYEFMYDHLEQAEFVGKFDIAKALKDGGFPAPANIVQTLGTAQLYAPDGEGIAQKMAVLSNNYLDVTSSHMGWGNNVAEYVWDVNADGYKFSGKWLNTPNHSAVSGFCMFSYNGKNYIVYPTGMVADNQPAGDGFFVMEEELLDTPKNMKADDPNSDWNDQIHKPVAYKYSTDGIVTGNNWRGINVEPMDGEDGKFRIYFYNPGKSMQVWQLDLTESAGINDIVADETEAKIFGGEGRIIVHCEGSAQVFSVAGQLIAEGNGSIEVPAGIYIVKADNKAAKIVVR